MTTLVNDLNTNGCDALDGTLEIGPSTNLDISSLSVLHSISGDLFLHENMCMTSASGLNNLTFVGNSIFVQNNPNLLAINLSGVSSGGDLVHFFVYGNTALQTLNAPTSITAMTGTFQLYGNPALATFSGLGGLTTVDGGFQFNGTQVATTPNFPLLDHIGNDLQIENNPNPTSLGMPKLATGMFVGNSIFLNGNLAMTEYDLSGVSSGGDLIHFFVYGNTALQTLNAPPAITTMTGTFQLYGNPVLTSFTGLGGLTHVDGGIQFNGTQVATMPNFPLLDHIGTDLEIQNNPNPTSLGMPKLATGMFIGGSIFLNGNLAMTEYDLSGVSSGGDLIHFFVYGNTALQTLNAPTGITMMTGTFQLYGNPALATFTGLGGLTHVDGGIQFNGTQVATMPNFPLLDHIGTDLEIQNNPNPTSLGMPKLATGMFIGGSIYLIGNLAMTTYNLSGVNSGGNFLHFFVYGNDALQSLNAPTSITAMTGTFQLYGNPALATFTGLGSLTTVAGSFQFDGTQVTSITNFAALKTVGGDVRLQNNPLLNACAIEPICYRVAANDPAVPIYISGNAPGCTPTTSPGNCNNSSVPYIPGCQCVKFFSNDGDAYGNSLDYSYGTPFSHGPNGKWKVLPGDCNDNDNRIHPPNLATDPSNGIDMGVDNDCDGLIDEPIKIVTTSTTAASCTAATGAINITVSQGLPPYTFLWSNGATTEDISGLIVGNYIVTVTDAQALTNTKSFNVTGTATINIATTLLTQPACFNTSDGAIDITPSGGGSGAFTYAWSNGPTTQDVSGLGGGAYTVTVTKPSCIAQKTFTLVSPPALNLSLAVKNVDCHGAATGEITAAATGGTGAKTYLWNTGATTKKVTGLAAGTYTVTATDARGCNIVANATLTDPTAVALTYTQTTLSNGKFKIVLSASGGTPYTTGLSHRYCRVNSSGNCVFSQAFTYSNLLPGSTHTFKARDKNGCEAQIAVGPLLQSSGDDREGVGEFSIPKTGNETAEIVLYQNQPNPFSDETSIRFYLPTAMPATLSIFESTGKLAFQQSRDFPAGENAILLNASDLGASRVLVCRLETPLGVAVRQMLRVE